ncbi:dihydropteroate synthase [Pediococcus parvulus]|uniref:dihydropteroate synthase n=1 Tax=Pediococcus parvulus TaxID=54062 RepID=UPI00070A7F99|nr:dihydropteroate synthase [Pediococcus parvulus]GEL90583.1 dihydropteroate synthase [Pediococcus parvulus]GHC15117.1 dihydropteroate synthase [Pediococcus parvulus]
MNISDKTEEFAHPDSFEAQIAYDTLRNARKIALQFTDLSEPEVVKLTKLLAAFDVPIRANKNSVQTVLPLTAFQLFMEHFKDRFQNSVSQEKLTEIYAQHGVYWNYGNQHRDLIQKPLIYGILNITPDSFYDGGRYFEPQKIMDRVAEMVAAGVDVIELGGQTTRPGFKEITADEELARIMPYVKQIHDSYPQVTLAVDTYKFEIMRDIVKDGEVDIINDVNAFTDDPRKLALLAPTKMGLLTMHSSRDTEYDNLTQEMRNFFKQNLDQLTTVGIDRDRIALDPGIGYAKVADGYQDYAMMRNIDQFNDFDRPTMIAISRKGFGAKLFGLKKEDRLSVTLIAETYMYLHGGNILRVHDITETKQLVKMLQTINNGYWFKNASKKD